MFLRPSNRVIWAVASAACFARALQLAVRRRPLSASVILRLRSLGDVATVAHIKRAVVGNACPYALRPPLLHFTPAHDLTIS
ncbi:uncharacterized protein B0H18DRAFT_87958 [Fomitopsis serialis]|uniref:uncharacterized protein n=1 Tax=Fomitopsis serialis TaxID=139415 RepID=UPI00200839E3|nr:uncharacterized protein B0H18DRAFT_87958 [Neoantrodia serialis]KAH9931567.1 hypothetical protein B0H18DRAFT_87958 [Neoantrodia serialis]